MTVKKFNYKIFLSMFCLIMVLGISSIISMPAMAAAPGSVSGNDADPSIDDPTGDGPEGGSGGGIVTATDDTTITINFYDSDGTTLILSVNMEYDKAGVKLDSIYPTSQIFKTVRRGYTIEKWYCKTNDSRYTPGGVWNSLKFKKDMDFIAEWGTTPVKFEIDYNMNGGKLKTDENGETVDAPKTFTVESEAVALPELQRKNYLFDGWYKDAAFKEPITEIPAGTYIDSDESGNVAKYSVYAKWVSAQPKQMAKPTAQNSSTGKIKLSLTKVKGVKGYEVKYSVDKNFKKNVFTKILEGKTTFTLSNLAKGTTYYFKVRAYNIDSTGGTVYGKYSSVRSCKVTKGVKEYTATSSSGKLKKVSVKNGTDLYVEATVSKRLASSDQYYYLVKVDPNTGKVQKQIAKSEKLTKVTFQIPLKDGKGNNHIQGKFGVAVKDGSKYKLISSTSYINNPEDAASYTAAFPTPASKKGRQGCYDSDMGDKNYFLNFCINTIIGTKSSYDVAYKYNGKTYYFYYPNLGNLSLINNDGGTVTMQIMLQWDSKCKDLILKSGRKAGANYYAFNTEEKAAREKIEAAFCFLAEEASKEDYHVDNWILGNEVNTYANPTAKWYYAGDISRDKFIENYASTFRILYYAVKSNYENARVYICTDHTWIDRDQDWGTKNFTVAFDEAIAKQNKNIQWNLAYHAYSAVLTNADFWNDGSLAPNSENADFVSPNNLEILTNYVKNNFGKDVRIILSEQGFSSTGGKGSPYNAGRQTGEGVQAAAVAWLYYKAQFNDMIDAVIFSAGDHGGDGYHFDFIGKQAQNVYKYMDTPKYDTYTQNCLKTIGASSWSSVVNGFDAKVLKKMPTRK